MKTIKCPFCGAEAISYRNMLDAIRYPCGTFKYLRAIKDNVTRSKQCIENEAKQKEIK
ncbi:MAG: hypothetical protein M0R17_00995 [Candidatus Omnitrophica bacterium]|jgi:transposase-like protein|nr:hypothetical protein [Candidatus Omnitrophota bacterium]